MKKNLHFLLVTLAVTSVFLIALKTFQTAQANVSDNFSGWAWSDNIGWVSFNCTNGGPTNNDICATSNYGVTKDASGNLSGYAWSDNIGWISFNRAETGNPPSGGGTTDPGAGTGAIAKLSGNTLTGWAKALAATSTLVQPSGQGSGLTTTTFNYTSATNGQTSTNGQGYVWNVPAGVTSFSVDMWGAGGKGGDGPTYIGPGPAGPGGGGGGGSGSYGKAAIAIPQGTTQYLITVGGSGQNTILATVVGPVFTARSGSNGHDGSGTCSTNCSWSGLTVFNSPGLTTAALGGSGGQVTPTTGWVSFSNGTSGSLGGKGGYTFCTGNGFSYPGYGGDGAAAPNGGTGGIGGKYDSTPYGPTARCVNTQTYHQTQQGISGTAGGLPGAGGGGGEGYVGTGAQGGKGRVVITYNAPALPTYIDNTGGWDGWISFSGTATDNSPYAITLNNTTRGYEGFSWGATVIGWLTFNPFGLVPTGGCTSNCGGGSPPPCCGVNDGSPLAFSATCTITSTTGVNPVTWTASAVGGGTPYGYSWNNIATSTVATLNHTYASGDPAYTPTLSVGDAGGKYSAPICPSETNPVATAGSLTPILLGAMSSGATYSGTLSHTVKVKTGGKAFLQSSVTGTEASTAICTLIGTDSKGTQTVLANKTLGGITGFTTTNLTTDKSPYTYVLSCKDSLGIAHRDNPSVTVTVQNNPTFQEF